MYGIDISAWQTIEQATWGQDFVIVKATEGTGYVSNKCDAQYQLAKKHGKKLGVYHYANGGDPVAEAQHFLNHIQGYIGEAILVLDWESGSNASFNQHAGWCKKFLDHIKHRTGVSPLIYMSASVIQQADWSSISSEYGLWIAGYPHGYNVLKPQRPTAAQMPYNTGAWETWAIWQYSSSMGNLDVNVANMDRNAWDKYAKPNREDIAKPVPAAILLPKPIKVKMNFADVKKWDLDTNPNYQSLYGHTNGEVIEVVAVIPFNGNEYYQTASDVNNNKHGVNKVDVTVLPEPVVTKEILVVEPVKEVPVETKPVEEVKPVAEVPKKEYKSILDYIKEMLNSILNFIKGIFK